MIEQIPIVADLSFADRHFAGQRIEIVSVTADVFESVLHLAVAVVIDDLFLVTDPLESLCHCTGIFIEQIPVSKQVLLTVLHLAVACIVNDFVLAVAL